MAGIKSLAVRGIRSFGPDDSDEQRVSFDTPLTLILGQNGCGKTTIIECLRYAVTGQMPPGSRNECFVHDAKVNRSSEVLGQVKLKIVNAKDKQLEIARSLKVTALPNKKSRFQTLDSFLSVVDDSGTVKDISSRCADLDSMVHLELGVSKAILNSVIFCHQEDSNWPLDEGKKVKERFDEIFDSDKYSDCFNKLSKIRKEYSHIIKMLNQEVSFLTEKKEYMDKKKLEQVDTETKISEAELKIGELSQELQPVSEKLKAIDKLQKDLIAFESKKEKVKTRLEHCRGQETELKNTIKNILEGTVEELQKQFNEYGVTAAAKKKEVDQSNKKIMSFNKDEEKIANQMTANEVKYNEMVVLERQNQERIDKKHQLIVETAKLAELEMETIENDEQAEAGITTITEKIKSLKDELKEQKSVTDTEEKELQGHVDEARDALSRHKQKITGKHGDINVSKRDIVKTEKEITKANESKEKLETLEKNLAAAEEEYQNVSKELDIEDCQTEIADDEKVLEKHEQDLEALNAKVIVLQKQTAKLKEKDMVEESLKSKEKQLLVLKNKHRAAMVDLLGEIPERDFAMNINKIETKLRKDIDAIKKSLKEKTTEITRLETDRDHVRETLKERRSELTTAEDQMYRACGTQPYDATLTKITASVETLQDDLNVLDSSMYIIKKYKKDLKENNCCPLCNRGFEAQNEVTDLISDLEIKITNVPAKLEKVREELQKAKAKKDDLLSLKTVNEKIIKLKEKDIPQLETRIADVDKKLVELNEAVEGLKMSMLEPEQKQQTAKQIQGDMPLMDRYNKEIQTTTASLEAIKAQCSDIDTEMTLDDATSRQTDLRSKISTLRARIKATQNKLNAHNKKLQTMMNKKNKMKEEMLNMQKKVQEIVTLQEKLKQLQEDQKKFEEELKELQEGVPALETVVKEKEEIKSAAVEKNRATLDVKRSFIVKIEGSFDKVKAIMKEIKAHIDKNIPKEMEKIKENNTQLMEKKQQLMTDRDELTKKIESLKEELARQDIYKRDIKDNLSLKKNQIEAASCETELENIEKEICGVNKDQLTEKEELINKQTELFREKSSTEGSLNTMKTQLKAIKAELNTSMMKNVEQKYREKFCELHVINALDKDVKNYAIALEKCLMEYHKEKMENINLIIREMWRKIYKGNDIDYIEIKTESTMTMESERRKYDYRVVQCKNGVEIDLRGRCSAGQRVLACLIIRLALAETFSSRFGVLALDEPTTNLDHENIRSLCSALADIVQQRMRQKNFMFIIITHDKEFIESLGSIEKVTHYFEVSRNTEGKSRVKKIRFS